MNTYYAYVHAIEGRGIFYVGKGTKQRARQTTPNRRNSHYNNIVNKYSPKPVIVGMLECSSESTAFLLEVGLIKCLEKSGVKLANKTKGGEGTSGYKMTAEEREALSNRMKGWKPTAETKAKISERLKGNRNSAGRVFAHSEASKEKMKISQKLRFQNNPISDITKEKMSKERSSRKYGVVQCPYCLKEGKSSGLKSWHFEYCYMNPNKKERG